MPAGCVFISYRRDDSAGYARAVGDALAREFGAERVFIDVDDIGAGQAFGDVIQRQLGRARLLLVLIGRRWLGEREGALPRLFDADDFVRREVATGLARGAVVLPVLLDGAALPTAEQLPPELRALTARQALSLDNARYAADLQRLLATVRAVIGPPPAPASAVAPRRRTALALGAGAGALLIALGVWWGRASRTPVAADVNGRWVADLRYGWSDTVYPETFELQVQGGVLQGTASFLRVPRGIVEGRLDGEVLVFSTRSTEVLGSESRDTVHRYRLQRVGDELHGVMQTEGGSAPAAPVAFVARRAAAATVPP